MQYNSRYIFTWKISNDWDYGMRLEGLRDLNQIKLWPSELLLPSALKKRSSKQTDFIGIIYHLFQIEVEKWLMWLISDDPNEQRKLYTAGQKFLSLFCQLNREKDTQGYPYFLKPHFIKFNIKESLYTSTLFIETSQETR